MIQLDLFTTAAPVPSLGARVLAYLHHGGRPWNAVPEAIAEDLGADPAALAPVLAELEQAGLVRRGGAGHRCLTEQGRATDGRSLTM